MTYESHQSASGDQPPPERPAPAPNWISARFLDPELSHQLVACGCQVSPMGSVWGISLPKETVQLAVKRWPYSTVWRLLLPDGASFRYFHNRAHPGSDTIDAWVELAQKSHTLTVMNAASGTTARFVCSTCHLSWERIAPENDCYGWPTYRSMDSRGLFQLTRAELRDLGSRPVDPEKPDGLVVSPERGIVLLYDVRTAVHIE